jgi:type VI secretion system secreted protein VgrG
MSILELTFESGEQSLSVRRFLVREAVSTPFAVSVWAMSPNPSLDLGPLVGHGATFRLVSGYRFAHKGGVRQWSGLVGYAEQVQPEPTGLSTYFVRIVPKLWLLVHRRGHRIFQHVSIPDVIDDLLGEWSIEPRWRIDRSKYPKLEYKVQYGETDYQFFCRLLEEAGIAFTFDADDLSSALVLGDRLEGGETRSAPPIPYVDEPNQASELEYVTNVRLERTVRPGAYTMRDYDFRNPPFALFGQAPKAEAPEDVYEQYHYRPGGMLVETGKGGDTPVADDKGVARYDQKYGTGRSQRSLEGERVGIRNVSFETNALDLAPGAIFSIGEHPHGMVPSSRKLLVTDISLEGTSEGEWKALGQAYFADAPYKPPVRTAKPKAHGIQSAKVVGPPGQEIHTDEFGRVRVQFPWDREGKNDEGSSCWIRVNQGWGGAGYGMIVIPRIGQEVLVTFLEGDPDQPVIGGRVYNARQTVPYKLPDHKTRSTWKSDSSLGSGGFNEIMMEDLAGKELVWQQAEKDRQRLVKNDEFVTVIHDRQKTVKNDESDTTSGYRQRWVGKEQDEVTKAHKRERIENESHLEVKGERREKIDGTQSLTVLEDQQEKVEGSHALKAGKQVHFAAGTNYTGEAGSDVTLKGPGGFIRIDGSGVTIKGTLVKINAGGSAGKGKGSRPEPPEEPNLPEPEPPAPPPEEPEIEAVEKTWIEIVLLDDGDPPSPVPYRRYKIEMPDGSIRYGTLDGNGVARFDDIDPGTCRVTFLDFDESLWTRA